MKFISVRELRSNSAAVWRSLRREKELVVTSNGKPIAIVSATDEQSLERTLREVRRARAIEAADELQRASVEAGRDRLAGQLIDAEIARTRKQARKRRQR